MKLFYYFVLIYSFLLNTAFSYPKVNPAAANVSTQERFDSLAVNFSKDAKIEIGSHYAGLEFHHGLPFPQRIGFYYPVANSIDLSTDYWKRDTSFVSSASLSLNGKQTALGESAWQCRQTPFSADFSKSLPGVSLSVSYRFCKTRPALIIVYEITNTSGDAADAELAIQQAASFRTCHSYNMKYPADYESTDGHSAIFRFKDKAVQNASLLILSAGDLPAGCTIQKASADSQRSPSSGPAARFVFGKKLQPGERLHAVLIIASCLQEEEKETRAYLNDNYKIETAEYQKYILNEAFKSRIVTDDKDIDKSVLWARALLATSSHYIDGDIMPMPCPAEYNFFFTHDVLLTDLSRIMTDPGQVKADLKFITKHGDKLKFIIPHAYYWRDSAYVTEYADADNWNHFWFVIASSSYLRHTGDTVLINEIYPFLKKSIDFTLQNKMKDGLMCGMRPDWWDIGNNTGPRTYLTILEAKALYDFVYISALLHKSSGDLLRYEALADTLKRNLSEKLWDDEQKFLLNYFEDGSLDRHYYIGSLLAAHFGFLDAAKTAKLAFTATQKMLDPKIGIYNVYPADFHLLGDYLKFKGGEAGAPFVYANGGVWPHGNAWYSLALNAAGRQKESLNFIKQCMTLGGIMNSPHGQYAMYEYRDANKADTANYGRIDKPQFMWASGWYLYSLYNLAGFRENSWNFTLQPFNISGSETRFPLTINGSLHEVIISGNGKYIEHIKIGDVEYCSAVLPRQLNANAPIKVVLGSADKPVLMNARGEVIVCDFKENKMHIRLRGFEGKRESIKIASGKMPKSVKSVAGTADLQWDSKMHDSGNETQINFVYKGEEAEVLVSF